MRQGYSTHYSNALNPKNLRTAALEGAESIMQTADHLKRTPVLVYTGMSGIAFATAISMALTELSPNFKFAMAYVRKQEEKSHGLGIEHNIYECRYGADCRHTQAEWQPIANSYLPIFVDDCIDTGMTLLYIMGKVEEYFRPLKVNYYVLSSSEIIGVTAIDRNADGSIELPNGSLATVNGTVETV